MIKLTSYTNTSIIILNYREEQIKEELSTKEFNKLMNRKVLIIKDNNTTRKYSVI